MPSCPTLSKVTVLAVLAVASCASLSPDAQPRPQSLVDAYLVAHGMATSYAESETAEPAVVDQLVRLDRKAAAAVEDFSRVPDSDSSATVAAISALTAFAARQAAAPQ